LHKEQGECCHLKGKTYKTKDRGCEWAFRVVFWHEASSTLPLWLPLTVSLKAHSRAKDPLSLRVFVQNWAIEAPSVSKLVSPIKGSEIERRLFFCRGKVRQSERQCSSKAPVIVSTVELVRTAEKTTPRRNPIMPK
jgi:hypothetical protein